MANPIQGLKYRITLYQKDPNADNREVVLARIDTPEIELDRSLVWTRFANQPRAYMGAVYARIEHIGGNPVGNVNTMAMTVNMRRGK